MLIATGSYMTLRMNVDFGIISKTRIIDYKYFKYSKLVLSRPFSAIKLSTHFLVWFSYGRSRTHLKN
jgi:hypothetical protein